MEKALALYLASVIDKANSAFILLSLIAAGGFMILFIAGPMFMMNEKDERYVKRLAYILIGVFLFSGSCSIIVPSSKELNANQLSKILTGLLNDTK